MYHQPPAEKVSALKTLLPLLYVHLSSLERLMQRLDYEKEIQEPKPPMPMWALLDCGGECSEFVVSDCPYQGACKGEAWESMWNQLRKAWKLDYVKRALMYLAMELPRTAVAVESTYVHPDEGTERAVNRMLAGRRDALADEGLQWMADGPLSNVDLVAFVPFAHEDRKRDRRIWEQQVRELRRAEGLSENQIVKRLGGSKRDVHALVAALTSAEGG